MVAYRAYVDESQINYIMVIYASALGISPARLSLLAAGESGIN